MSLRNAAKILGDTTSQMLYPENIKCIFCDDELSVDTEYSVCQKCVLPFNTEFCLTCGRHMENMAEYCISCMNKKRDFDLARSVFTFTHPVDSLIYRLKFGSDGYLARYIAKYLHALYLSTDFVADAVTFVPIHKSRRRKRGYNQCELIAMEFCKLSGIPLIEALEKHVKTKPMSKIKSAQKRAEIIKDTIRLIDDTTDLEDKNIILIDDVATSGATMNECSRILRQAKVDEIMVLSFASVEIKPDLY